MDIIYRRMFASIGFPLCSLFFVIFILVIYLNKKKYNNLENILFLSLVGVSILCIIIEILNIILLSKVINNTSLISPVSKIFLGLTIIWYSLFSYYILILSTRNIEDLIKKKNIRKNILILVCIIAFLSLLVTYMFKIDYTDSIYEIYNFSGSATYPSRIIGLFAISILIYLFIFKNNFVRSYQRLPILFAIIIIISTSFLQYFIPNMNYNFQNFRFTLLLMALYFTIESQDNKLLDEHDEQRKEAEIANREQTEFLTSMSHEIRTPMNTIMGYSDIILREGATDETSVKSDVKDINKAAIHLLELINNILDMSRMESGREEVIEKEYDVSNLIIELNDSVKKRIDGKNVKYELFVDSNIPSKLIGDYSKISKIIINLISNVTFYSKDSIITIKLAGRKNEKNEFYLDFSVTSLDSEISEVDYNKYYLNNNSDNRINSVILDLTVAKMYANMLNTNITQVNKDRFDVGYSVSFYNQILNPSPIGDVNTIIEMNDKSKNVTFEGKKILIVDDNMINVKLLKRLLEEFKADIDSCNNGYECIDMVSAKDYDLIFLDHMMPGIDGVQTLAKLKDLKQNLPPVIALTANQYSGAREQYIEYGFTNYLAKPINRNNLNKLIVSELNNK